MFEPGRYAPKAGTLASTACITLAFPPVEWAPLICFGLVPWLFALKRCATIREAVAQGLWLNLLLGTAAFFWIAYAVPHYLGVSFLAGIFALLLHALLSQLPLTAFATLHWLASRATAPKRFIDLLSLAALYTGIDWAMPKLFQDALGVALHGDPALRQLVAFGGVPLLTFVVLLMNLGLFSLASEYRARAKGAAGAFRAVRAPLIWVALPLVGFYALGSYEYRRIGRILATPERIVRVGLVQGNVADEMKRRWARGDAEAARESLDVYLRATEALIATQSEPPEIVIWPETSYPGVFRKPENDAQLLLNVAFDRFVAARGTAIIFGAYDREDRTDRRVLRNALYFVQPSRNQSPRELSPMQVYHKSILLPVGEYFPLLAEETIRRWLPHSAHFSAGAGAKVYTLKLADGDMLRLGPAICYEDLFSDHTARLADEGAEVLVNVSNDSWFGDYGAARLHLILATLRSVETRLPQIRATNTGYSGLILPNGDLQHATDFGSEAVRAIRLPIIAPLSTLRLDWGEWFGPASLVLGLFALRRNRGGAA